MGRSRDGAMRRTERDYAPKFKRPIWGLRPIQRAGRRGTRGAGPAAKNSPTIPATPGSGQTVVIFFHAVDAQPVTEANVEMIEQVVLQLNPHVVRIADFFAPRTNRQEIGRASC